MNRRFPTDVQGTTIKYMDLNDPSSFITVNNVQNRKTSNRSLAMEWIYEKKVGVMIASNLGRPGGACSQVTRNNVFTFQEHADVRTQEESVLTCIHQMIDKRGRRNYLDAQLSFIFQMFGMHTPNGNPTDFIVEDRVKNRSFNVRDSADPNDYSREIGSSITIVDKLAINGPVTNNIYLSFIAGPNASAPRGGVWDARKSHQGGEFLQFDTMFRTISKPALDHYHVFRSMIKAALIASLHKMLQIGYKYAIMASPSSGIYAGAHKGSIQHEYHDVCIQALEDTYMMTPHRFTAVIVPKY
jgi:hypothetical protein